MKVLNLADASDLVTHTNFICKYCGSRKKSGAGLPKVSKVTAADGFGRRDGQAA
ncbi:hypothetical protein [Thauera sp.]|uniref:hypothetical protein n=1 Tax=Thauera sp. TaxID=1905334 RepID=UPI00258C7013|nr:hypothetical protein [Thauera sp.]